jgi:microcystin-dependent protein
MTLDAGSGNVGIRTGSPGSQLTVNGLVESMAEGFKFPDGTIQETAAPGGGIPLGVIIMWSGSLSSIPAGWALCDGTNGTPDLRDRFILSVSAGQNPGGTGGSHQVTLTVSQMPAHEHSVITNPAGNHRHDYLKGMMMPLVESGTGFAAGGHETAYTGYSGTHTHTGTALSTGGGQPFDNRPAYYKLAFIMKL